MDGESLPDFNGPEDVLRPLLSASNSSSLCAGEVANQNAFLEQNGIEVLFVSRSAVVISTPEFRVIRIGLQVLANVSLAGEKHQQAIWLKFFPNEFSLLARVRSLETSDPLCMILAAELCRDSGLPMYNMDYCFSWLWRRLV
ncbi:uncharacterized protein LOC111288673 [Durio zibethinus]|uniref:Uncharacterized protein LOC111288673 n=1 Tax=Durio zibethinus TaxID=66656 RepID=A0A6P5Y4M3_DURZI|nr:uncharacterized protein LOC111288673 [Durio zibethinus]